MTLSEVPRFTATPTCWRRKGETNRLVMIGEAQGKHTPDDVDDADAQQDDLRGTHKVTAKTSPILNFDIRPWHIRRHVRQAAGGTTSCKPLLRGVKKILNPRVRHHVRQAGGYSFATTQLACCYSICMNMHLKGIVTVKPTSASATMCAKLAAASPDALALSWALLPPRAVATMEMASASETTSHRPSVAKTTAVSCRLRFRGS